MCQTLGWMEALLPCKAAVEGRGEGKKRKQEHLKCSSALMGRREWVDKAADRHRAGLSHSLGSLPPLQTTQHIFVSEVRNPQMHSDKTICSTVGSGSQ